MDREFICGTLDSMRAELCLFAIDCDMGGRGDLAQQMIDAYEILKGIQTALLRGEA